MLTVLRPPWRHLPLAIGLGMLAALPAESQSPAGDYIHTEVQGAFEAVPAAADEHAGFQIQAHGITWEVDASATSALRQEAERLAGRPAIVAGSFVQRTGLSGRRRILVATAIKPAAGGALAESIHVTVRGTLTAGVMAIGAETTGVTITANGVTWDLALEPDRRETVGDLSGTKVVVSGQLRPAGGVEIKGRLILHVRALTPAKSFL